MGWAAGGVCGGGGGGGLGATTGFGGSGVALCVVHVGGTLVKRNKRHGTNRDFIDRLVQTELIAWDFPTPLKSCTAGPPQWVFLCATYALEIVATHIDNRIQRARHEDVWTDGQIKKYHHLNAHLLGEGWGHELKKKSVGGRGRV